MKYALFHVCDQTICYLTADGMSTTVHAEAVLFDDRDAAETIKAIDHAGMYVHGYALAFIERFGIEIEAVADEAEFRAREDTW